MLNKKNVLRVHPPLAQSQGLYIGFSTNLKKRIAEHEHWASFATKYRGPWKLIYYEAYVDRDDAEGGNATLKAEASIASCVNN